MGVTTKDMVISKSEAGQAADRAALEHYQTSLRVAFVRLENAIDNIMLWDVPATNFLHTQPIAFRVNLLPTIFLVRYCSIVLSLLMILVIPKNATSIPIFLPKSVFSGTHLDGPAQPVAVTIMTCLGKYMSRSST